jgi:hypothetical protein
VRRYWGGLPTGATGVRVWAEAVAAQQADTDPRVSETWQDAERAHRAWRHLTERHLHESAKLNRQVLGSATPSTAVTRATAGCAPAQRRPDATSPRSRRCPSPRPPISSATAPRQPRLNGKLPSAPKPHATREPPGLVSSDRRATTAGRNRTAMVSGSRRVRLVRSVLFVASIRVASALKEVAIRRRLDATTAKFETCGLTLRPWRPPR